MFFTFREYCDVVAEKILAKAREVAIASNREMFKSPSLYYDLFLSHKRLTGQGKCDINVV